MIVVREVFSIEPDHMKEAKELMREYMTLSKKINHPAPRIMTDLVATHYTLVMETEFEDLSSFEKLLQTTFSSDDWQKFYPRLRKFLRGGRREIYQLLS
jgi:hypothetical protein